VPEGIVERVKNAVMRVVAENIQREEFGPTQDKIDKANTKIKSFADTNGITVEQ